MIEIKDLSLKCPKCGETFSVKDFDNNKVSQAHFQQFLEQIANSVKNDIEKKCEQKLTEKFENEQRNKFEQFELKKQKEIAEQINLKSFEFNKEKEEIINKYNEIINNNSKLNQELKSKIDNLELQKEKEIAEQINLKISDFNKDKEQLLKKFNDEINLLNKTNQELQANINNLELQKQKEITEKINLKIIEFNQEKENLTKKFNDDINLINKLNQEIKAKLDNLELQKEKEIAEQINLKISDFNKDKEQLLKKFNYEINLLNKTNQELNSQIKSLELQKEKEIAEQINIKMVEFNQQKEEIRNKFNEEIEKLKHQIYELEIENTKNRLINNKIQGENLEQEIEEELSKIFLLDSISKINTAGKKADLLQKVKIEGIKEYVGTIAYEIKNTKDWNDAWETKFLDDMRRTNSRYGIITATAFSSKHGKKLFKVSEYNSNIYFCSHENVSLVAQILRMLLITEYRLENAKNDKTNSEIKLQELIKWKNIHFPNFSSKIKNSIESLEKVKVAISNQMTPLEKNIKIIRDNFVEEVEKSLERLL